VQMGIDDGESRPAFRVAVDPVVKMRMVAHERKWK
jgi:hypothetical protein